MSAKVKRYGKILIMTVLALSLAILIGLVVQWTIAQSGDIANPFDSPSGFGFDPNLQADAVLITGPDPNDLAQIYRDTIDQSPGSQEAFAARRELAILYIEAGHDAEAQTQVEQMLSDFALHKELPHAVHAIAEQTSLFGKGRRAVQLYQELLESQPLNPGTIWLQMGTAMAHAYQGNDDAAWNAIGKLTTDHAGDPGIVEAVNQVAWSYRKLKKYRHALSLYQYTVDNWPQSERAILSQRGLAFAHIGLGNDEAAWDAVETLKQEFTDDPLLAEAIYKLAGTYRATGKLTESIQLNQYYLQKWPNHTWNFECQRDLVYDYLSLGDDASAQQAVDTLRNQFADHPKLPYDVYKIAREMGYGSNAASLYQFLIDNYPDDPRAIRAKGAQARIMIRQGNEAAANAILSELLSDHAGHPILPRAVALIAQSYYDLAFAAENSGDPALANTLFQKSIAVWQIVIEDLPANDKDTPEGHHLIGECYRRLGQPKKAIAYYRQMLRYWPDYRNAWNVQFQIGYCYQQLKRQGVIAQTQANKETSRAYRQVLANYPTCKAAGAARNWLSKHK